MGTSNGKGMILSICAICSNKKSRFIKNQEAKKRLSNLGLKTPLSKVPALGNILVLFLLLVLVDPLQKTKKEFKNLKKQETQTTFTKMNLIKLVFNMI